MTKDLYKKTKVYCGNPACSQEELGYQDVNGRGLIFFCCPVCGNRIGMPDYERMIDKIDKMQMEDATAGNLPFAMHVLTNVEWKNRQGIKYKILEHDWATQSIKVSVFNEPDLLKAKKEKEKMDKIKS